MRWRPLPSAIGVMVAAEPGPDGKRSDLGVRAASAIVMIAVAGTALWLGGWVWALFVIAIAAGVLFEWRTLVLLGHASGPRRVVWTLAGLIYCLAAVYVLLTLRGFPGGAFWVLTVLLAVIGTDIGAYFAGRTFGGPKIAPRISPSKTWSGLAGGIIGASMAVALTGTNSCLVQDPGSLFQQWALCARLQGTLLLHDPLQSWPLIVLSGIGIAVIAQAGDFFESWMKRRAGVKDSGRLLPGHGGLFDRVDGLLSVLFVLAILFAIGRVENGW